MLIDLYFSCTGTGRSVPSTPLQVSPQGEQIGGESSAEIAPSVEQMSETSQSQGRGRILYKNI